MGVSLLVHGINDETREKQSQTEKGSLAPEHQVRSMQVVLQRIGVYIRHLGREDRSEEIAFLSVIH